MLRMCDRVIHDKFLLSEQSNQVLIYLTGFSNSGVWFMHCHLERHSSWGMDTVLIVKNGKTEATSMLPPPSYLNPC